MGGGGQPAIFLRVSSSGSSSNPATLDVGQDASTSSRAPTRRYIVSPLHFHPPGSLPLPPGCAEVMRAIKDCHTNNPYLKFLGVCNDKKTALNLCLRGEVSAMDHRRRKRGADGLRVRPTCFLFVRRGLKGRMRIMRAQKRSGRRLRRSGRLSRRRLEGAESNCKAEEVDSSTLSRSGASGFFVLSWLLTTRGRG